MKVYFDHNATTPIDPRVIETMLPFMQHYYGNPSSLHKQGRLVRSAIDSAREQVAQLVGAQATQIIFTSGGTEANNLALHGKRQLAIAATEHPSVTQAAHAQKQQNGEPIYLPVDNEGLIPDCALQQLIKRGFRGNVAIMLANNETGVLAPIMHYQSYLQGLAIHCDAVQAAGKIAIDFKQLQIDSLSLSAHKLYGPKGIGALVVSNTQSFNPLLVGGGQEKDLRAGTENVSAIIGFGKAAELARLELAHRQHHLLSLRTYLEAKLSQFKAVTVFAQNAQRLVNTIQFGIKGIDGEMLLMQLDSQGIAVSSGSACASGGHQPSPVLTAMGIDSNEAKTAIRISLGVGNTQDDIDYFMYVLSPFLLT